MPIFSGPFSAGGDEVVTPPVVVGPRVPGKALPIARDLAIDPITHDLVLTGGDLDMVADGAAIRQEADIRLQFMLGEWFMDTEAGVPYFQNILVKSPNLAAIETILTDEILSVSGIDSVLDFTLNFNRSTRKLAVTWRANCAYGELTSNQEF